MPDKSSSVAGQVFEPNRAHESLHVRGGCLKTKSLVSSLKAVRSPDLTFKIVERAQTRWRVRFPDQESERSPLRSRPTGEPIGLDGSSPGRSGKKEKRFRVTFGLAFRPPTVRSALGLPVSSVDLSVRFLPISRNHALRYAAALHPTRDHRPLLLGTCCPCRAPPLTSPTGRRGSHHPREADPHTPAPTCETSLYVYGASSDGSLRCEAATLIGFGCPEIVFAAHRSSEFL